MRSIIAILVLAGACHAQGTFVQGCKKANGGVAAQLYTTTVGSSGGTTGCTTNYAAGHILVVGYNQQSGSSDRTTSNISATGATITWHKATSIQNSVFGPPGYFTGIFYACPTDITSPTSSIAITVDMGASMAGITSIFTLEAGNVVNTSSCLDKTVATSDCCSAAQYATGLSGTLSTSSEFVVSVTVSKSGAGIVLAAGSGSTCATTCLGLGTFTIPAQGQDSETDSAEAIEYVAVLTNASGSVAFNQSPTGLAQNIVGATFLANGQSSGRGPKGKIL